MTTHPDADKVLSKQAAPSNFAIFKSFLKLGVTAFGGPAMVAYIRTLCVTEKGWVTEQDFRDGAALVQTIPGATAMQAAAYAGLRAAGPTGALAAYVGFGLPAFMLMLLLSGAYMQGRETEPVVSLFAGLQLIVIAMVSKAALDFARKIIRLWQDLLITSACAMYIIKGGSPVIAIVASALSATFFYGVIDSKRAADDRIAKTERKPVSRDRGYATNIFKAGVFAVSITALMLAILFLYNRHLFNLAWMMIKIDCFAFGGGYASLPMMLHELVQKTALLDTQTLMDGIALGQITPGPIVITATFAGLLLYGLAGAATATIAVFTPSFIILMLVTPWFDRIRHLATFQHIMQGVLCSFTGLLVAVAVRFAMETAWNPLSSTLCAGAFMALMLKTDIMWVVLGGAVVSLMML